MKRHLQSANCNTVNTVAAFSSIASSIPCFSFFHLVSLEIDRGILFFKCNRLVVLNTIKCSSSFIFLRNVKKNM